MKTQILVLTFMLAFGCKTNNKAKDAVSAVANNKDIVVAMDTCPEDGECQVALKNSATMTINEDSIGMEYPTSDKGDNMVVRYTYLKKGPKGTADGDYSETLHFEIPANTTTLSLMNSDLQNVDLLFGKHCFCKGEAGYYKVTSGSLTLVKTENELTFDISYSVGGTSHKIKRISKKIQLR